MTTPTCTETVSPNEVRAALVMAEAVPFPRCSIWRQAAKDLAGSRPGLGSHTRGNATGSRDAP